MLRTASKINETDILFAHKAAPYFLHNTGYFFDQFADDYNQLVTEIAQTAAYLREQVLERDTEYVATAGIRVTKAEAFKLQYVVEYSIEVTEDYIEA